MKEVVDDKTRYIDWDKKADIKAQLKVQIILTLAKHKYPPATRDEVFKAIFEQAENFKKNRPAITRLEAPFSPTASKKTVIQPIPYILDGGNSMSMAAEDDE